MDFKEWLIVEKANDYDVDIAVPLEGCPCSIHLLRAGNPYIACVLTCDAETSVASEAGTGQCCQVDDSGLI